MNQTGDKGRSTETTDLYLVRVWKRRSSDGALSLHGKLQHAVSGASCYFDGLSSLPGALEEMINQATGSPGPHIGGPRDDEPEAK